MKAKFKWAAKLPPELLARLYRADASGLADNLLAEDVGLRLYLRCESIKMTTEKSFFCPSCGAKEKIDRPGESEIFACPKCSAAFGYADYLASFRHRDLREGNAGVYINAFLERYLGADTYGERLILIDTLIHSFHIDLKTGLPNRATGNNLIEGSHAQVVALLDTLSGVQPDSDEAFSQTAAAMWKRRRNQ